MKKRVSHIATSQKGPVFLVAEFEKKAYSWNLDTYERISEFDTVLDYGGFRLAITEDGKQCVAAAYNRYGLAMYDVSTGSIVWSRKDIKGTQYIKFDPANEKIYVGFYKKPMLVIDRNDGSDIERIRSAEQVYFDYISSKRFFLKDENKVVGDGIEVESPAFTFFDAQPTKTGAALCADDLIYYDLSEQKITWRVTPGAKEHFLKLAYSIEKDVIFALLYKYDEPRTSPYYLLYRISADDGAVKYTFPLPLESFEFGFAQDAAKLICSSGELFDISSSEPKLIHKFVWF